MAYWQDDSSRARAAGAVVAALAVLLPVGAPGQSTEPATLPWPYSSYFGTGWYEVGERRDAFIIRYVPRRTLREPVVEEDGARRVGFELRAPLTVGLNEFPLDDVGGSVDPDNVASASVTAGVDVEVPVARRWSLRPYAALGWGAVLNGGDSAWTWWAGVKSRRVLREGTLQVALINSVGIVGYSAENDVSDNFLPLGTALEWRHPIAELDGDDELQLIWHAAHTHFHNDLDLRRPDGSRVRVGEQWEAALAFGRKNGPIRIWRLSFDRLGLAYRFSPGGDLRGIGLVVQSLFDR